MELQSCARTLALTVAAPGVIRPADLRRHPLSSAATRCPPCPALGAGMTGSLFKANFWVSERTRERAQGVRLYPASVLSVPR